MKAQRFEYQNKDVPMLKKEVFFRMLFMLLFVAIFVWQFVLFVFSYIHGNLTTIKLLAAIAVLIVALLFAMVSFIYGLRCLNIIQKIALHGNAVRTITIISSARKSSFLRLYLIVTQLIAIAMIVVMACTITYSVLQYVYFTTVSYYLPILFLVAFSGFNSVYHIKQEIKTIQNVNEFNSMF